MQPVAGLLYPAILRGHLYRTVKQLFFFREFPGPVSIDAKMRINSYPKKSSDERKVRVCLKI